MSSACAISIIQSLTFITLILSEKMATLKFWSCLDGQWVGQLKRLTWIITQNYIFSCKLNKAFCAHGLVNVCSITKFEHDWIRTSQDNKISSLTTVTFIM